jgi:hypothetical protein|tara:strand:- start:660 stop:1274 length:615 start_codon:yes stop_codon:yes gene_type:complete
MRNNNIIVTLLAVGTIGLTGCSGVNENMVMPTDQERYFSHDEVGGLRIPVWFTSTEMTDTDLMIVTATDVSVDMQFAIDKATLSATVQLAQKLKTDVKSLVRESTIESGFNTNGIDKEIDRVSKSSTSQSVGFYRRENLEVVKEGDLFRAYIRLSLDVNEGRRLISDPSQGSSRDDRLRQLDQMDSNVQYDPTNNNVSSLDDTW